MNSISAAIKYDFGFVGRHWAEEVDLLTITATANIACQVNESFAIFAGVPMMFGSLEITFARLVALSVARDVSDHKTLLATVHWEDWSTFDEILITTDQGGGQLSYDWKDTWKLALGLRHRTGGPWTYYTGVAYDSSPTSAYKRTADMPIDRQWRFSAGASYELKNGKTVAGSFTWADYGKARIDNSNGGGTVVGEYSTNRILFSRSVTAGDLPPWLVDGISDI